VKKVPDEFRTYIETMVDSVGESEANFEAFVLCFEAVVGYFYGEGGK
jgi:CRISPR/Cas system CSM-associated protein Csm2 small subunit